MDIRTYPRGDDVQLTPHVRLSEMECRCGRCPGTPVDLDHLRRLEELRAALGAHPITITSGYRCPDHNAAVGGHPSSEHMDGTATDVVVRGVDPDTVADCAERLGVFGGVGRYDTFTHLDGRLRTSRWDRRTGRAVA